MQLLIDLHRSNFRQGSGGEAETRQALSKQRVILFDCVFGNQTLVRTG